MHWLHNANNFNKLRLRIYPLLPLKGSILGFKFHFRGRFSRKQRAASIIIQRGNMPLTTISASIDYAFFTMPLDNSLVSIKIWILKHPFALNEIKYSLSTFKILPKQVKNLVYNRLFTKFSLIIKNLNVNRNMKNY